MHQLKGIHCRLRLFLTKRSPVFPDTVALVSSEFCQQSLLEFANEFSPCVKGTLLTLNHITHAAAKY